MLVEVDTIDLGQGWGLRRHDDDTLELTRRIEDEVFVLEIGVCNLPRTHPLEEGVNYLKTAGTSLSPPN
jgi:hypothetical protein